MLHFCFFKQLCCNYSATQTSFLFHNFAESIFTNLIVLVDIYISPICRQTFPSLALMAHF